MFVAEQQLTSLSPRREILCNQNMIARGYAAELSVARSTNASKLARSRCKANALFLRQKNPTFQSGFLPSKERFRAIKQTLIAHDGCAAELSVARSTNASKLARSR